MAWMASSGERLCVSIRASPRCPRIGVRLAIAVVRDITLPRSGEGVSPLQLRHVAVVGGEASICTKTDKGIYQCGVSSFLIIRVVYLVDDIHYVGLALHLGLV